MRRDDPLKCPYCGGFPQYFKADQVCRDCGRKLRWNDEKSMWDVE